MKFFSKNMRPEDLGALLYESIRTGVESNEELSVENLMRSLDRTPEMLHEQYRGEVVVALMFAAVLAIERSATPRVGTLIGAGMRAEFLNHLEEQGANVIERAEWETVIANRFLAYRKSMENYSGFEPPWKLGREFFWNLTGEEVHVAMCVKIATLYLLSARDQCQELLNLHGPTLYIPQSA